MIVVCRMSTSTGEGQGLAKVVEDLLALLFQGSHVPDMVRVVVVLASGVFLLLSLLLNIIVMVNICYMKRIQVRRWPRFVCCFGNCSKVPPPLDNFQKIFF